jgi:tetratricopeptide (TPR) repeat protein
MTKAAFISLGLAALVVFPAAVFAQDTPAAAAVNEAVMRQANTIVLRQKLSDARAVEQRGDLANAAKLYQESVALAEEIGSGIDAETQQAVAGLVATRLTLAREAQSGGDLREANAQVVQALKADPKNNAAIAFKDRNDQMLVAMKGRLPDEATMQAVPVVEAQKTAAGTLLHDGILLYEMGKYNEAEIKLTQSTQLNPDNTGAFYYLNLIQQAKLSRDAIHHSTDTQIRIEHVEKQWVLPKGTGHISESAATATEFNSYATNTLVYTGPGRQHIMDKLDRIRLDDVSYDGVPLATVLADLSKLSKLRDPERKGINFLINNNPDLSGAALAAPAAVGVPGVPAGGVALDQNGLPTAPAAGAAAGGGGDVQDVGSYIVKIPSLSDVRLADVLDAIQLVTDHPIKYSIQDFAIVFSAKGPETPQLFMRTFRVDPNTFYSGLESVSATSFGGVNNSSSGGGGGGNSGGGGGSGGNNQNNGAVVGVVNAFAGAGGLRNQGNNGGGGGNGQGAVNPLNNGGGAGAGGGGGNLASGGLNYITQITLASTPSVAVRNFFATLGVNLAAPPGKSIFFNDRLGLLFVKATESDLDTIERAIQALDQVPPQVHIKARFIEVSQSDNAQLGFDWYMGQFNLGNQVVGQAGNPGALSVPVSPANPNGYFPDPVANPVSNLGQQLFSSGLAAGGSGSTTATITGILTNPNFQVVLHALESRSGAENLGEPEATTISGRQTQMRATSVVTVVIGLNFQQGTAAGIQSNGGGAAAGQ